MSRADQGAAEVEGSGVPETGPGYGRSGPPIVNCATAAITMSAKSTTRTTFVNGRTSAG